MSTCREESLAVLPAASGPDGTFDVGSVLAAQRARGSRYTDATVRTPVTS